MTRFGLRPLLLNAATLLLSCFTLPLLGQQHASHELETNPHLSCATSEASNAELTRLEEYVARTRRNTMTAYATAASIHQENGIIVVNSDEAMRVFDKPFDLAGSSIVMKRLDNARFEITRTALQYDANVGSMLVAPMTKLDLTRLTIPFYDGSIRSLTVSDRYALFPEAPIGASGGQYASEVEVSSLGAIIAPLLQKSWPEFDEIREVWVNEAADALTVTWRARRNPQYGPSATAKRVDIQVKLHADGNLVLSYREVANASWGSVVVTSGREAWRQSVTGLMDVADPAGDNLAPIAEWTPYVDIRNVTLGRVGGSEILRLTVTLSADMSLSTLPGRYSMSFVGGAGLTVLLIHENGKTTITSGATTICNQASVCSALSFSGKSFSIDFSGDAVSPEERPWGMTVYGSRTTGATTHDSASGKVTPGTVFETLATDISGLTEPLVTGKPMIETFTLPTVNLAAVWAKVRDHFNLQDAEVDQVAIYPTFFDALQFTAFGMSTGGNSGADGVSDWPGMGSSRPKTPALLHMGRIGMNALEEGNMDLLTHEFGHRWLLFAKLLENGVRTNSWNPDGAHPHGFVHTASAFPQLTAGSSPMGGWHYTDLGANTFRVTDGVGGQRYFSWMDLYLMGLASADEARKGQFFIAGSSVASPLTGVTFQGQRVETSVDQVIAAMGPRQPRAELAQRTFRMIYVVLDSPSSPANAQHTTLIASRSVAFATRFAAATGSRGRVISSMPVQPAARMEIESKSGVVQFRDVSTEYPTTWLWTFPGGATSVEQHPLRGFGNGTHTVTLTVSNSAGTSTTTRSFEVTGAATTGRRRAARS